MSETPPSPLHEWFVLHPSVIAGWWFPFVPHAGQSEAIRDQLRSGRMRFYVSHDSAVQVLARIEETVRADPDLDLDFERSAVSLRRIVADFRVLAQEGIVRWERQRPVEIPLIWGIHSRYGVSLPDARHVWLALRNNVALLHADDRLRTKHADLERDLPELRLVFVPDLPL